MLEDHLDLVKGQVVYRCSKHDYGLASDHERITGEAHLSVSATPDGDYPFTTIPKRLLEKRQ